MVRVVFCKYEDTCVFHRKYFKVYSKGLQQLPSVFHFLVVAVETNSSELVTIKAHSAYDACAIECIQSPRNKRFLFSFIPLL